MNRAIERNLLTIITSLEQPAGASAAGYCGDGEPGGCLCRGQRGHSDAG